MSEFEALFESAVSGGLEDRLVLADWLDEHGSPDRANRLRGCAPTIDLPLIGNHTMRFAWVPPGESWLGGGRRWDESSQEMEIQPGDRYFILEKPLWCGIYPVTQSEWEAVMGNNPSEFKNNPTHPVEQVSLLDVQAFLEKVNQERSGRGHVFRLPTQWEWEYICRGGPLSRDDSHYDFTFARSRTDLTPVRSNDLSSDQANFNGNFPAGNAKKGPYLERTSPVGTYLPNPLGIFDMHGNVGEWTSSIEAVTIRVHRGGSWSNLGQLCTSAYRNWNLLGRRYYALGFRVVAVPLY